MREWNNVGLCALLCFRPINQAPKVEYLGKHKPVCKHSYTCLTHFHAESKKEIPAFECYFSIFSNMTPFTHKSPGVLIAYPTTASASLGLYHRMVHTFTQWMKKMVGYSKSYQSPFDIQDKFPNLKFPLSKCARPNISF